VFIHRSSGFIVTQAQVEPDSFHYLWYYDFYEM